MTMVLEKVTFAWPYSSTLVRPKLVTLSRPTITLRRLRGALCDAVTTSAGFIANRLLLTPAEHVYV